MNPWDQDEVVSGPWEQDQPVSGPWNTDAQTQSAMSMDRVPTGEGDIEFHGRQPSSPLPEEGQPETPTWNFEGTGLERGMPPSFQDFLGGAVNAPRNIVETGLAITDAATGANRAESFRENIPIYKAPEYREGMVSDLMTTGGELVVGVGGSLKTAGKAIEKAVKDPSKVMKAIKNISKTFAAEAGGAAAIDKDIETMFIGDEAMLQVWEGMGADSTTGRFSEELLRKRLDILADAIVLTKAGEVGTRATVFTGKLAWDYVLKPVLSLGSKSEMEKTVVKDILNQLVDIDPDASANEIAAKYEQLVAKIDAHKDIIFPSGMEGVDDIVLKRDTMTALGKGAEEGEELLKARARGVRSGIEGKGSAELETAVAQPSLETEKYLNTVTEKSGGPEAIEATRESIQQGAIKQTDDLMKEISTVEQKIISSKEEVASLIKEDPVFGAEVEKLGNKVNIDLSSKTNATADEILENVHRASDLMTKEKNRLFDAIPETAQLNTNALADAVEKSGLPSDTRLVANFNEASQNYKSLHNFATGELSDAIADAVSAQDFGKARAYRELKHHILGEQLDYLVASGDTATRDAAQAAMNYYTKEYAPFWRDGKLADLQYIQRTNMQQPLDRAVKERKTLKGALTDPEAPEYSQQIIDLLNTDEGGRNGSKVLDYALGRVISEQIQPVLNSKGKLDPQDIQKISDEFSKYIPVFEKTDPKQVERINTFLTQLRDKDMTTKELETLYGDLVKQKDQLQKDLFEGELRDFFDKETGKILPRENSKQVFENLFNRDELVRDLPNVIKRAGKENLPGLKAAYSDFLKDKVFREAEGLAGEKLVAPVDKAELDKLYKAGDLLFEDQPEIMQAVRGLVKEVQEARSGTVRRLPTFDTSTFRKGASGAVDFMITQVFGALNRMGARIRSGAGRVLRAADPAQDAKTIMDTVMANPDEFVRIARDVAKNEKVAFSPDQKKALYKMLIGTGVYSQLREEDFDPTLDEQMEDNFR